MAFAHVSSRENSCTHYADVRILRKFVDLMKTFDGANQSLLWKVLCEFGCPQSAPFCHNLARIPRWHKGPCHLSLSVERPLKGSKGELGSNKVVSSRLSSSTSFSLQYVWCTVAATLWLGDGVFIRYRLDDNLLNDRLDQR